MWVPTWSIFYAKQLSCIELLVCKQGNVPGRAAPLPHMSPVESKSGQSEHNRLYKSHFSLLISVLNFLPRRRWSKHSMFTWFGLFVLLVPGTSQEFVSCLIGATRRRLQKNWCFNCGGIRLHVPRNAANYSTNYKLPDAALNIFQMKYELFSNCSWKCTQAKCFTTK